MGALGIPRFESLKTQINLNPDQRVSAAGWPTEKSAGFTCKDHLRVIAPVIHHRIMNVSITLRIPVGNHSCNWSPRCYRVTPYSHIGEFRTWLALIKTCAFSELSFCASSSFFAISSVDYHAFSRLLNFSSWMCLVMGGEWLGY